MNTKSTSGLSSLDTEQLLFEEKPLYRPGLDEVRAVMHSALSKNFATVSVEVVDCPDLTAPEYSLVASGLCGDSTLVELGGAPYLLPMVDKEKIYNISEILRKCMGPGKIFAVGAGAGPYPLRQKNAEGIYNMLLTPEGKLHNGSFMASIEGQDEQCTLRPIPDSEPRCAVLLNLFASRGEKGPVIKVSCKKRIGSLNFIECIRLGLQEHYRDKCIGMGGLFLLKNGKAYQHVMREFSSTPINTLKELNQWLKFFEMPAVLHALGTLVTHEHDLDLRLQHFHSFSQSNWGGHYHYDTTPNTVEYEAYLNLAERVVRVDKPLVTHKFGRD